MLPGSLVGPWSISRRQRPISSAAMRSTGMRTLVRMGSVICCTKPPSKPVTATSWPMRSPVDLAALTATAASTSLPVTMAVGRRLLDRLQGGALDDGALGDPEAVVGQALAEPLQALDVPVVLRLVADVGERLMTA